MQCILLSGCISNVFDIILFFNCESKMSILFHKLKLISMLKFRALVLLNCETRISADLYYVSLFRAFDVMANI